MEQPTNIANANLRDIALVPRHYPFVLSSAFNFLSTVMHIITVSDFPSFWSNSSRKCLILPAVCSPQKSLILFEILPAVLILVWFSDGPRSVALTPSSRGRSESEWHRTVWESGYIHPSLAWSQYRFRQGHISFGHVTTKEPRQKRILKGRKLTDLSSQGLDTSWD